MTKGHVLLLWMFFLRDKFIKSVPEYYCGKIGPILILTTYSDFKGRLCKGVYLHMQIKISEGKRDQWWWEWSLPG